MTPEQAEARARHNLTGDRGSDRGPLIGLVVLGAGAMVLAVTTFRQPTASIGDHKVPHGIHCQEDEVLAVTGPDGVHCVHVEGDVLEP